MFEFKKEVAECKAGMFEESWYLRVVKARFSLEQAGIYIVPFQRLIKDHGREAILEALKHHSIPYVPLMPPPDDELKWPYNYEFVNDPKHWNRHWRNNPIYNNLEGAADELDKIRDWLSGNCADELDITREVFQGSRRSANLPNGAKYMELRKFAYDLPYDDLHRRLGKEIPSIIAMWAKARPYFVKAAQQYDGTQDGIYTVALESRIERCDLLCLQLGEMKAEVYVKGKGYHSKAVLEECWVQCRQVPDIIRCIWTVGG